MNWWEGWTTRSFGMSSQPNIDSTAPSLCLLRKSVPSRHALLFYFSISVFTKLIFFPISAPWKLNSLLPNTLLVQSLYRHIRSEWNYRDARHKTCIKNFPFKIVLQRKCGFKEIEKKSSIKSWQQMVNYY